MPAATARARAAPRMANKVKEAFIVLPLCLLYREGFVNFFNGAVNVCLLFS